MNRYAIWKYVVLGIALFLGAFYTLPNFYGEAPAVQISAAKATAKVDLGVQERVESVLKAAGLAPELLALEGGSLKVRFDSTDAQIKAKDAIQQALVPDASDPSYVVALNLLSRSPAWLSAMHAAPMYLGLLLSLVALLIHFVHDFLKLFNGIYDASAQDIALKVLGLLDTTLLGNLVVLMIFSGYENFVSKINSAKNAEDRPTWMGKVDYSGLKIKLIGSLVAISVIELLKDFVEAREDLNAESIKWRIAIHLTFVISGLLFAVMDYIADKRLVMDKKGEIGPH